MKIPNEEPQTKQPGDPTLFTNVIVLATYGLGAALDGDVLPPLCFPTSSTRGKPRDNESHVLNRLISKLIQKKLFEPSQPDDIQMIRSKCAPWQSDRDLDEFVAELQMDTAELSVKMSYEAAKVTWASRGMKQTDLLKQLKEFVDLYDRKKCLPHIRSDANLRPELQDIFSGCNVYYEPHQQNT